MYNIWTEGCRIQILHSSKKKNKQEESNGMEFSLKALSQASNSGIKKMYYILAYIQATYHVDYVLTCAWETLQMIRSVKIVVVYPFIHIYSSLSNLTHQNIQLHHWSQWRPWDSKIAHTHTRREENQTLSFHLCYIEKTCNQRVNVVIFCASISNIFSVLLCQCPKFFFSLARLLAWQRDRDDSSYILQQWLSSIGQYPISLISVCFVWNGESIASKSVNAANQCELLHANTQNKCLYMVTEVRKL